MQAGIYVCHATPTYIYTGEAGNLAWHPTYRKYTYSKYIYIIISSIVQTAQISFHPKKDFLRRRIKKRKKRLISEKEKKEITERARKEGFNSLSQFLLWLYRKFGKG